MDQPRQQDHYGDNRRREILPLLPRDVGSVLDVGCGRGGFGVSLREALGPSARLVGVEAVAAAADVARRGGAFDDVVTGYFPQALVQRSERFDLVSFNDVLEHMVDPWAALSATHSVLTPQGRVLAAIPNVRYAPVLADLLRGRWTYTESGVLDRTHLRFFTKASMLALFHDTGFRVEAINGINPVGAIWRTDPLAPRRWAKAILHSGLGDTKYSQFVVTARPNRP